MHERHSAAGTFGCVHLVQNTLSKEYLAFKALYFDIETDGEVHPEHTAAPPTEGFQLSLNTYFFREVEAHQKVHSPFVLGIANWGLSGTQ